MLYIGRPMISADLEESQCNAKIGIIIPSRNIIAYINYTSQSDLHVARPELVTSKNYEFLTTKVSDILHWEWVTALTSQQFLHNAVTLMDKNHHVFFVAKVDNLISQEDKVVGHCDANFRFNFRCPLFGLGITETWFQKVSFLHI